MAGYCRYKRLKKQVSYDSGATWQDVSPAEYMKGDLIESASTICGYAVYTRWVESGYTCVGYDKHAVEYEQTSNDNINWTYTQRSRTGRLLEANSEDCGYVPPTPPTPTDYSTQYLTFRALEDCSFSVNKNYYLGTMSYSLDSGDTWVELANTGGTTPTIQSGDTVMWKGVTSAATSTMGARFNSSYGRYEVEGNIMSLKYGDNFSGQTTLPDEYSFCYLFSGDTRITSAENLVLPATATTRECYMSMFRNCTNLTTAPSTLPATSLFNYCYQYMFAGCTSLTAAPTLPATDLGYRCYDYMFSYCTSLTTPPELPATTLSQGCYRHMFEYCTSLTTAPVLSAATLAQECYYRMFYECVSLGAIACLATDIRATDCTYQWLYCVSSSGTFIKAASMNDWPTGNNGIPSNWIVLNNS